MALENFFPLIYEVAAHFPGWAAAYLLPPITIIIGLVFFMAIVLQAKLKQDRKRQGVPEYVPEHPYVSRLASKEEIEALLIRAGIRVVKDEDAK